MVKGYSKDNPKEKHSGNVWRRRVLSTSKQNVFKPFVIERDYKNKLIPSAATMDGRKLRKCDVTEELSTSLFFELILGDLTVPVSDETGKRENE